MISIFNKKGGVGKTSFAFSIAKDLGFYLQSNDASLIETIYPEMSKISERPTKLENCVYDFGGFVDAQHQRRELPPGDRLSASAQGLSGALHRNALGG